MKILLSILLALSTPAYALVGKTLQGDAVSGTTTNTNFITNGDAEYELRGVAAYADGSASPVDCTGGSPGLTVAASATNPISGNKSWLITKGASNQLGQGVAFTFKVSNDIARIKMMELAFRYSLASGFISLGDSGDMQVFLYDVDAAKLIPIQGGNGLYDGEHGQGLRWFQSTSGSNNYRLCFHQSTTSTTAYSIKLDDVMTSLSKDVVIGSVITPWQSFTGSITGTSSGTLNVGTGGGAIQSFEYQRVGPNAVIKYTVRVGSSGASDVSGVYILPLPAGLSAAQSNYDVVGYGDISTVSSAAPAARLVAKYFGSGIILDNADNTLLAAGGALFNNSNTMSVTVSVKIQGWNGTLNLADSYVGRTIATRMTGNSSSLANGSTSKLTFATTVLNSGGINYNAGDFTIASAGLYRVTAKYQTTSSTGNVGGQLALTLLKNGSSFSGTNYFVQVTTGMIKVVTHTDTIQVNPNDVLSFEVYNGTGATITGSNTDVTVSIEKISTDTAVFNPSAKVKVIAVNSSAQSIPTGTSTILTGWTKSEDSYEAFNASTGIFTAPKAATYTFCTHNTFASASWSVGNRIATALSASPNMYIGEMYASSAATYPIAINGCASQFMALGATTGIWISQPSGGSRSLTSDPSGNHLTIFETN